MRVIVVVARHHDIVFHLAVGELGIHRSLAAAYHEAFFATELRITSVRISMGDEIYNVLCPLKSRVCRKVKILDTLHVARIQTADILIRHRMKVYEKAYALIIGCLYRLCYRIHTQLRYVHPRKQGNPVGCSRLLIPGRNIDSFCSACELSIGYNSYFSEFFDLYCVRPGGLPLRYEREHNQW